MPFRQQDKDYSCGAAALRYALTFLGRNVGEKDLRRASLPGYCTRPLASKLTATVLKRSIQ